MKCMKRCLSNSGLQVTMLNVFTRIAEKELRYQPKFLSSLLTLAETEEASFTSFLAMAILSKLVKEGPKRWSTSKPNKR